MGNIYYIVGMVAEGRAPRTAARCLRERTVSMSHLLLAARATPNLVFQLSLSLRLSLSTSAKEFHLLHSEGFLADVLRLTFGTRAFK